MNKVFEKIIEKLEELQNYACFPTEWVNEEQSKIHSYYANKLTEILKLTEQYNNGWISCREHQPEEAGTYNVTAYDGRKLRSTHAKWQPRLKSWNLTGTMAYWKVIAWQPLPQPYQLKGE